MPNQPDNKPIYSSFADKIFDKRFNSPSPLRRYAHWAQYQAFVDKISPGESVLDAGCGEGVLSCLLAKNGVKVTGVDISEPNIAAAKKLAKEWGVEDKVSFQVGDAENLPFPDENFEIVISSHVLEHIPNFNKGLSELHRVSRGKVIVAMPTILNLCSIIQAGHGSFWELSKRSLVALPWGFLKTIFFIFTPGVNEGYAGRKELVHIWRYPWIMKRQLKKAGFKIMHFEASSLCLPFFNFFLPLIKKLDKIKAWPLARNFGYGSTAVLKKK